MPEDFPPFARAPYNFVPPPHQLLNGRPKKEELPSCDRYAPDRHTGWLDVTYRTLTPTFTRAARPVPGRGYPAPLATDANGQSADFFHYGDNARTPVLPGSSLRGMVRGVFEILTYSRLDILSEHRLSHRGFAAPKTAASLSFLYNSRFDPANLVAGVLHHVGASWELHVSRAAPQGFVAVDARDSALPADLRYYGLTHPARATHQWRGITLASAGGTATLLRDAQQFTLPLYSLVGGATSRNAYLIVPGKDVKHRHHYQAVLDPIAASSVRVCTVPHVALKIYEEWRERSTGTSQPRALRDGDPAFAVLHPGTTEADVIFAGLMPAFRYAHSVREVADRHHTEQVLPQFDMTQAVFGRISPDPGGTRKTRVFFEDALTTETAPWLSPIPADSLRVPDPLLSPKPTAVQMYLDQPEDNQGYQQGDRLRHWDSTDARIRGFKRYWHRSAADAAQRLGPDYPLTDQEAKTRTRIRPVRTGVTFTGRVRFENLSSNELGALLAAVRLPAGLAHRFGMGKSFGLGSLEILSVTAALLDVRARYATFGPAAGRRPPADVQRILKTCYQAFVNRVRRHENSNQTHLPNYTSLWHSDRLRALGVLLRHDPLPDPELTRQVGVDADPDKDQWSRRIALPYPLDPDLSPDHAEISDIFSLP